jgi:modulator of FtsH protease HflC
MTNRQLAVLGFVAVVIAAISSAFFVVQPGERVAVFALGRIQGSDHPPGLHFKLPFVQSVTRLDGRVLTLDGPVDAYTTQDQKSVRVDYFLKWRIADTLAYYKATGGQQLSADGLLASMVNRGLGNEVALRPIEAIIAGGAEEIATALMSAAAAKAAELGVELVDLRIRRIELPDELRNAYYDRMRAERRRVAAERSAKGEVEAEKIRAEADRRVEATVANAYRDAEKMRGEGDARAAEIYARAYGQDPEFYSFYRSLDVYREAFRGQQNVFVLEPKGEFFRYFKQSDSGR